MKRYSEIKLDENQKEFLQMLLDSGYSILKQDEGFGLMATGVTDDEHKVLLLSGIVEPNTFNWVKDYESCEIEKLLNPPHKTKTVWNLKDGDEFWFLTLCGHVCKDTWNGCYLDVGRRNQGNVFLTKEEAEFESKRREVVTKVKKYARPFNPGGENWAPYWNRNRESIGWNSFSGYIQEAQLYFENEEKAKQAIAEVGEDDFKKYYLGVTE